MTEVAGAGSTFHVWLPKAPGALPPETPAALEVNTVLLVEDDADVREVARLELSSLGYEVFEASDGESALELLHEKSDIGLLATDLELPGLCPAPSSRGARSRSAPTWQSCSYRGGHKS